MVDIWSYQICTEDGRVFQRNRKQSRAVRPVHDTMGTPYDVDISVPVREPEHGPPLGPASGQDKGMGNLGLVPSTEAEKALVPQASSSQAPRQGSVASLFERLCVLKDQLCLFMFFSIMVDSVLKILFFSSVKFEWYVVLMKICLKERKTKEERKMSRYA